MVDWIYENLNFEHRSDAVKLAIQLLRFQFMNGITTNNHLDVDSPKTLFRFAYERIKEWHGRYNKVIRQHNSKQQKIETPVTRGPTELTERDWKLILSGANLVKFMKDEIVIEQGSLNCHLYRIKEGGVRVEKSYDGQVTTLAKLGPGSMFGEMSVLSKSGKASASIISDQGLFLPSTEIWRAEVDFMHHLFQSEPGSIFIWINFFLHFFEI